MKNKQVTNKSALMHEREDIVANWEVVAENEELQRTKYTFNHPTAGRIYAIVCVEGVEESIEIDDGEFLTFIVPVDYSVITYTEDIERANENYWGV